ncbi:MAG: nuclear transport factor 2 family protein [Bacteroidota bacterium]
MKKIITIVLLSLFGATVQAQDTTKAAILQPIQQLFEGMANKDTLLMKSVFHTDASLSTTYTDKAGKAQYKAEKIDNFITSIGKIPAEQQLEERILDYQVKVDDNLAVVWTPYEFYLNGNFSHCGVNAFTLFKAETGWVITAITDTRRRTACGK